MVAKGGRAAHEPFVRGVSGNWVVNPGACVQCAYVLWERKKMGKIYRSGSVVSGGQLVSPGAPAGNLVPHDGVAIGEPGSCAVRRFMASSSASGLRGGGEGKGLETTVINMGAN